MLGINLEHLQLHEVKMIMAVLERDAQIQRQDDERRRKLQSLIRGERIPQKRLSIKCKTGEWMREVTAPSRASKKKGVEVVRASIKVKSASKPSREIPTIVKTEAVQVTDEIVDEVRDYKATSADTDTYTDPAEQKTDDAQPMRRTSFRKKKTSPTKDKQVKFAPDKTEKFVYEQTKVNTPEVVIEDAPVPTIIIDDVVEKITEEEDYKMESKEVKMEKQEEDYKEKTSSDASYASGVYSSGNTFESYHNSVGKDLHKDEAARAYEAGVPKSEKPEDASPPKGMKKIKVIKRKGSSRRKVIQKITDDSTRNTFFSQEGQEEIRTQEEVTTENAKQMTDALPSVVAVATAIISTDDAKCEPAPVSESYTPPAPVEYPVQEKPKEIVPVPLEQDYTDTAAYPTADSNQPDTTSQELDSYKPASTEGEKSLLDEMSEAIFSMPQPGEYKKTEPSYPKESTVSDVSTYEKTEETVVEKTETDYKEDVELNQPTPVLEDYAPKAPSEEECKTDIAAEIVQSAYEPQQEKTDKVETYSTETTKEIVEETVLSEVEKIVTVSPAAIPPSYDAVTKPAEPEMHPEPYVAPAEIEEEKKYETQEAAAACEGEESKGSPTTGKLKKKVVKKIKKKAPKQADDENTPPKTDATEYGETVEEPARNLSRMQRGQTVRKKVVRKKAPPKTEE